MILNKFPDSNEFYKTYWGKKPFIVRNFVTPDVIDQLIDGDTLAGLSLEEDIKSRIIINNEEENTWTCHHGAFDEDIFAELGEENWSLLVQNVEQYHTETANLLGDFHFCARWLMDDIMVSYSAKGGSVGPHTDSYHVFLIQGIGKRKWKISDSPCHDNNFTDSGDIKVLKYGFNGQEFEVSIGDIIYIPPHFAHEGITLEEAMSFSVGFLGPKLSELMSEYAHYLEQNEEQNTHYCGDNLTNNSAAFTIAPSAQSDIQNSLITAIKDDDFSIWLAQYFSTPTHDEIENIAPREEQLTRNEVLELLKDGESLYRPEHIKITITTSSDGNYNMAVYGETISTKDTHKPLIELINSNQKISLQDISGNRNKEDLIALITDLYNRDILSFDEKH